MKAVLAIAALAMRAAVRSRVVACLLVLLGLTVIGLPLTVKGDGTVEGYVQILLTYTLGASALLLSITTLWAGCAAVSADIAGRQLQLVAVKPVSRPAIWLGKWIGLLAMNTLLLSVVGAVAYGLLHWNTRPGQLSPTESERLNGQVLVARRLVAAQPVDVEAAARKRLEEARERGQLPNGMQPADALAAIRKTLLLQAASVGPGARVGWIFTPPARAHGAGQLALEYKFAASRAEATRVAGVWIAAGDDGATRWSTNVNAIANAVQELPLPAAALAGTGPVQLSFVNQDPRALTLIFDLDQAPRLLVPEGGFGGNFARALMILWIRLAFLGAIGLTAGSLFSMPVAAFFSLYAVALLQARGYVQSLSEQAYLVPWRHAYDGAPPGALDHALRTLYRALGAVLAPLGDPDPLGSLAAGELIDWPWVLRVLLTKGLLYSGLLALVAGLVLNRRELARAGEG